MNLFYQKISKILTYSNIFWFFAIVAALFVRLYGIENYSLSNDEAWHLVVADQENLWEVVRYNFSYETHPPLSPIIWHFMLKISHNILWLKASSLLASILLIPSAYIFGRLYIGRAAGITMALICAFGGMPIVISAAIRAYTMLMLALLWLAIFAFKYQNEHKKKYLLYYLLCCFLAIELHHSAAFAILPFGLILLHHSFYRNDKKDFFLILISHAIFAIAVAGYAYVLTHYYDFKGNNGYYTARTNLGESFYFYLINFIKVFTYFLSCSKDPFVIDKLKSVAFFVIFFSYTYLASVKKWSILSLIFIPFFAVGLADYLHLYPLSPTTRNNLFLILPILTICGYFVQLISDLLNKYLKHSTNTPSLTAQDIFTAKLSPLKIIRRSFVGSFSSFLLIISSRSVFNFPKLLTALLIIFLVTFYISNQNFYRTSVGGCQEFLITETGQKLLIRELKQRQSDTNVFISLNSDIWKFQFDNRGQTKIITPNLAIFQNDEFLIYFSAFPEREKGANTSIENYKLFFTDLFDYLKSKKEFNKIKSITFFDAGFHNDYLDQIPQASFLKYAEQTLANKNLTKDDYNFWSKIHDLALSIHNTQYPMKFYSNDPSSACGRKILILSLTPDFVKNNILTIPTK